jgi:hypothetical protein
MPLKCQSTSVRLHSAVSQKTAVFMSATMRTWNLATHFSWWTYLQLQVLGKVIQSCDTKICVPPSVCAWRGHFWITFHFHILFLIGHRGFRITLCIYDVVEHHIALIIINLFYYYCYYKVVIAIKTATVSSVPLVHYLHFCSLLHTLVDFEPEYPPRDITMSCHLSLRSVSEGKCYMI